MGQAEVGANGRSPGRGSSMSATFGASSPRKRITVVGALTLGEADIERLQSLGELTVYDDEPGDEAEVLRRIGESEIVVTGGTPIPQAS